jgi:hypothetical protein
MSRKSRLGSALVVMFLIGWLVGMQPITLGQQSPELTELQKRNNAIQKELDAKARDQAPAIPGPIPTMPAPIRPTPWEYKSVVYTDANANILGKEGWELVAVFVAPEGHPEGVFKRSSLKGAIE